MGSKSRSRSSQTTHNTSTSLGVQGDNNGYITNGDGNTYNITQTDHGLVGAIESLGADMMAANIAGFDYASDIARDGFDYSSQVNRDSLEFAGGAMTDAMVFGERALTQVSDTASNAMLFGENAMAHTSDIAADSIQAQSALSRDVIAENSDLAREMMAISAGISSDVVGFAGDTIDTTVSALDGANARMSDVAIYSMDNASNLAKDLGLQFMESTSKAQETFNDQTLLAHKQALQFADHASRSDGQQLAISTNKTMMYVMLGLGGMSMAVAMMRAS
ncbi:hypothetical protein WLQ65_19365 [Pseudoalteromonas piscicida]|uniref:hypothetical protein n=1 Tax=Pseudoalteromonas piscicida TaxID=43662 RepID=UPI0030C8EB50